MRVAADDVVIMQTGRMVPAKGQALHLEALGRLRVVPRWVCWQVGPSQLHEEVAHRDSLKHEAAALGIGQRVRFIERWPDLSQLYAAADIYCQPNLGVEPFGLAFIEALYAGFPCIATRGSGGPEMIIDQNSGVVVPSNDADVPAAEAALCDRARQINQLSEALHQVVSQSRKCSVARLLLE